MENQHQLISGYRELNQEEIDLMNEIKAMEARCLKLHLRIVGHLAQRDKDLVHRTHQINAQAYRWLAIGRTDIETGFMALTRSVAQPRPNFAQDEAHD